MTASRLPSRGPTSGRKCYVTPSFSGVPKQGDKIRSGYLTTPFLGAHKWAELLRNPSILRGPQTRGQNQKWLPHPCPLGGPQAGGSATYPLHSRGSPAKGTKLEVAASPMPSWGPTSGQNRDVSAAFSWVPKRGDQIKIGHLPPPFLGAHKWVELLRNPCLRGGGQQRGQNQNWLPEPCVLAGPQVGGIAT